MNVIRYGLVGWLALAAGCGWSGGADSADAKVAVFDSARPWRKPGDKIDSILPMPEYIRRFREGLTEPTTLSNGAASREALARQFLTGISRQDTAVLGNLLITRAEFAWLIFPEHLYAIPPYELDPAIFWIQLQGENQTGFHRLIQRYGGKPIGFLGLACQRDTLQIVTRPPGKTTPVIWSPCEVRYRVSYRDSDSTFTKRLFGSIVERDGQMKFLTYSNEF